MQGHDDRQLERLAEQIRAIEKAGWAGHGRYRGDREDAPCSTALGGGLADVVATGWPEVDRVLGGGGQDEVPTISEHRSPVLDRGLSRGLQRRALHEWFGMAEACAVKPLGIRDQPIGSSGHEGHSAGGLDAWTPPLCLLVHLAWQTLTTVHGMASEVPAMGHSAGAARRVAGTGEVVWIGRRCWPHPRVMVRRDADAGVGGKGQGKKLLQHSLFADPSGTVSRLWAIDLALRSPAVTAVVADGSGFDMAATRRLQLAAESGQGMVLLARPLHELSLLSVAATRWVVGWNGQERKEAKQGSAGKGKVSVCDEARVVREATGFQPRWMLMLKRCRWQRAAIHADHRWTLEWKHDRFVVVVPSDLADRPGHSAGEKADIVATRRAT